MIVAVRVDVEPVAVEPVDVEGVVDGPVDEDSTKASFAKTGGAMEADLAGSAGALLKGFSGVAAAAAGVVAGTGVFESSRVTLN